MKKSTLEITDIENGKPVIETKNGYTFTAKTSDGVEIELFVYKENTWFVIDPISTKCVSLGPTRYNAILSAEVIVESMSHNDFMKGEWL